MIQNCRLGSRGETDDQGRAITRGQCLRTRAPREGLALGANGIGGVHLILLDQ